MVAKVTVGSFPVPEVSALGTVRNSALALVYTILLQNPWNSHPNRQNQTFVSLLGLWPL